MDRRADRLIAVAALTAVAVVPAVLLVAIKVGQAEPKDAGELPPAAAYQPRSTESASRQASPLPRTNANGSPVPVPTPTVPTPSGTPSVEPFTLKSYLRVTEGSLTRAVDGGGERVDESSSVVLAPEFGQNTQGSHEAVAGETTVRNTLKVIVRDGVLQTYDGKQWTRTTLTDRQLADMKAASDPRLITFTVATLPGVTKKGPDRAGRTRYTGSSTVGDILAFLPRDLQDDVGETIPADTAVTLETLADKMGRPSLFTLVIDEETVKVRVRSTFTGYR